MKFDDQVEVLDKVLTEVLNIVEPDNHYKVLELSIYASQQEINKAFTEIVLKWRENMDQNAWSELDKNLRKASIAYEVLNDTSERAQYDKKLFEKIHYFLRLHVRPSEKEHKAATKIQKNIRGYLTKQKFQKAKKSRAGGEGDEGRKPAEIEKGDEGEASSLSLGAGGEGDEGAEGAEGGPSSNKESVAR